MKKRWVVSEPDIVLAKKISKNLSLSSITAKVLVNRGVRSEADADTFLNSSLFDLPSPFLMRGMQRAVDRLSLALQKGEKIAIYGDYDVDGVTATAVLYGFLREIGGDVTFYNPKRLTEGYGINIDAVKFLAKQKVNLIVSGDCGITAVEEVKEAKRLGVDFIITDHHKPPKILPDAISVINPHIKGCTYPGKEITGVGVIFNLVIALRRRLRELGYFSSKKEPNLGNYLDLVALGTVADCAPLINVNRIFVKEGLKRMSASRRVGIEALKRVSGLSGSITSIDLGFRLGPRVNAIGRLDSVGDAVRLFLTADMEEAMRIAETLNRYNSERQNIEKRIFEEAISMIEDNEDLSDSFGFVLASIKWHSGVIGIVASRIVEKYGKPTFLIAVEEEIGKGSGRGVEGVNLYNVLLELRKHLEQFGGHELAAGITIKNNNIKKFRQSFNQVLKDMGYNYIPTIKVDGEVCLSELTPDVVSELSLLEPFGLGNPEPVFISRGVKVSSKRFYKDKHLGLTLTSGGVSHSAVQFNSPYKGMGDVVDIVFTPKIDKWNGKYRITLNIKDILWYQ